jgi:uncharacterized membrane protein YoaK (UPF0700 family)
MKGSTPLLVAAVLTWTAGYVDAVGYISLAHIYTANMSGNSVAIGVEFVSRHWSMALLRFWPVVVYVLGVLACRLMLEAGSRFQFRRIASVTFAAEVLLLIPVSTATAPTNGFRGAILYPFIGLLALAMGMQNGTLTHFSSLTLHTGFVTGTLVKMAEQYTKYLTWAYDRIRSGSVAIAIRESFAQRCFKLACWLTGIWIAYVIGACCGALVQFQFNLRSLTVAMAALISLIAVDMRQPLAVLEEQHQSKLSG